MTFGKRRGHRGKNARIFDDETLVDRPSSIGPKSDPAQHRLCRRVAEVIETRLTACREPILEECRVARVLPISGVKLLLVALAPIASDASTFDAQAATVAAQRAARFLRSEVAAALNRKQAPQLRILIVPPGWQGT